MDNLDPNTSGNLDPSAGQGQQAVAEPQQAPAQAPAQAPFSWKQTVAADVRNSPMVQKFEDTPEGLTKALSSYGELEQLLGHEKIPVPKGDDDVEGWNRFNKAMGIPDRAIEYGLPDAELPDEIKGLAFDKNAFAEIVHAHKLTPSQAKGLWAEYNRVTQESYQRHFESHKKAISDVANKLRSEWGDQYETNVELGQMVINKFSADQEMNDFLTATLSKDPRGIKFLAKLGDQFAENKIGSFSMKKFSLAPDDAKNEIDKIVADPNHPYNSEKATPQEHTEAIDYVNSLYKAINRAMGQS